ncbi:hypothetical protein STZ1_10452 [Bacillus subtilis]
MSDMFLKIVHCVCYFTIDLEAILYDQLKLCSVAILDKKT